MGKWEGREQDSEEIMCEIYIKINRNTIYSEINIAH